MPLKWIACMFHLDEDAFDFLEETLCEYDIGKYLIGYETTPYPHYHLCFEGSEPIYHKFSKRVILRYGLRGQAKNGLPKQYGKIRDIHDIEKLLTYCSKEGNVRGNFTEEEIQAYIEKSYKKDDKKKFLEELIAYLDDQQVFEHEYFIKNDKLYPTYKHDKLRKKIIRFLIDKDMSFTKNQINHYVIEYLRKTACLHPEDRAEHIYYFMYM